MTDADRPLIDGIARWVRQESPTRDAARVNKVMALVADEAKEAGIATERVPGRDGLGDALVLRAGPVSDRPGILILSHLDTVHPVGTLDSALPVRVEGDRLYGPGVYDMKGGAFLAFQAFKHAAASRSGGLPLVFLFTPDEEIGSPTSRALIEAHGRRSSVVLVTEPARDGGRVVTSRKGVGRFQVGVEGRPSHAGSRHPEGRSAIREAAAQITAIEAMTDYARGVTTTVGLITGGTAENVIPQHCRFSVDLRVETVADGDAYEQQLRGLLPIGRDVTVQVTGGMNRPPFERSEGGAKLYEKAREIAAGVGLDLQEAPRSGGGSDGNFTAAFGIPTLDGLGIDGDGAHTLHEHALISSMRPRLALLTGLLQHLGA